jgi:uncharacterized protein YndB with AHSA1/START domain
MSQDVVSGASVEVTVEALGPPQQVWELITDVTRIGEWSPECVKGWWVGAEHRTPEVGAHFEGHNRYPGGFEATARCVVTEVDPPRAFAWAVLDSDELVDRPGSVWSYRLVPSPTSGRTMVTHRFVHGQGMTGVRRAADLDPEHAQQIVDERLALLESNMTRTIEAMSRSCSDEASS